VAAISFSDKSENKDFKFYHNIFVGKDSLIKGRDILGGSKFTGNDWWSIDSKFKAWGINNFKQWAIKFNQEQKNGKIVGMNINPVFKKPDLTKMTEAGQMPSFKGYQFSKESVLKKKFGGDLKQTLLNEIIY